MKNNLISTQNDWQFHAALSRESIVTNENLFNLLYLSNDTVNKEPKDLIDGKNLRTVSTETEGAPLQHDIILINSDLYNILEVTYSTSIYTSEKSYLTNAIAISNPVYDTRAAFKYITLYNPSKASSITIRDLASKWMYFSYYTEDSTDKAVYGSNTANRYLVYANKLADWLTLKMSENIDEWFVSSGNVTFTSAMTIKACKDMLTDAGKIAFDKLLSLHFHDKDSAKLPYAPVNLSTEEAASNVRKLRTRFLMNLVPSVIQTTSYDVSYNYLESMSLLDEDNIDQYINAGQANSSEVASSEQFKSSSKDLQNAVSALISRAANLELAGVLSDASTQIYAGVEATDQTSTAISLVDSEDSAIGNIFKNSDNIALKFYKRVKLTNAFADVVLYLRNPWYRMAMSPKSNEGSSLSWSVPTCSIQLTTTDGNASFSDLGEGNEATLKNGIIFQRLMLYTLVSGGYTEDEADAIIYKYLSNETLLFKAPYFGDFIEKTNFEQDLTEDSSVMFEHSEIKRTDDPSIRNNDAQSTIETLPYPYLQQTSSLIDSVRVPSTEDILSTKGYERYTTSPDEDEFKYFSHSLSAKSIDGKYDVIPPIFFDIDAEADKTQKYYSSFFYNTTRPQLNLEKGSLNVEGRLTAPVIDDIWKYFKYLTESTDESILPEFKGLFASALIATNDKDLRSTTLKSTTDRAFKKASGKNNSALGTNTKYDNSVVDILRWHPYQDGDNGIKNLIGKQLTIANYTGYKIDEALYKPVDYAVKFFGRRNGTTFAKNGDVAANGNVKGYEFEDDQSGYLESVLDSINVSFKLSADPDYGNPSYSISYDSAQRRAAYKALNRIVSFGSNNNGTMTDGSNDLARHFNYKQYKDHPKNLRVLERNLEEIRQNLMAFAEFVNATFVKQGYGDAAQNRGTLYQLHRNYFISERAESDYSFLTNDRASLDLTSENLTYANGLDKVVNYDDGIAYYGDDWTKHTSRYNHDSYGQQELVYTDPLKATRKSVVDKSVASPYSSYKANQIRLSEVYLAADGTWRYVGEHMRAPLLKCKY